MNPFTSSPTVCTVSYACKMTAGPQGYNLCDYTSDLTSSTFNATTGNYYIQSNDYKLFGTQTVTFDISVTSGSAPQVVQFVLDIVDPCLYATLSINKRIIDSAITYGIMANGQPDSYTLDSKLITVTPPILDCPFELQIMN